jgi:cytochrome c oxidase cbb3-type subunit 1
MYLAGGLIMAFNVTMTILGYQRQERVRGGASPAALQPAE